MNVRFPIRGAFYYPWYPETWPAGHVFRPSLGEYDSVDVVARHVEALVYGRIKLGIASWWGPGTHREESLLPKLLDAARGTAALKWTVYYEKGGADASTIASDLAYLRRYTDDRRWARVDRKPVVFIYNVFGGCEVPARWSDAAPDWYFVPKLFSGWRDCTPQPPSWHQYGPDAPIQTHSPYSSVISPGFWKAGEAPRLARDPARFEAAVEEQVASGTEWQLVTTFNEWGEGTAIESATEWATPSGFGRYLDILHAHRVSG